MLFTKVNPETFIVRREHTPEHGRGSWNKTGKANSSWRYEYIKGKPKIGSNAEQSLDAWATCAGSYAFQLLLIDAGYLRPLEKSEMGLYGQLTLDAVKKMQGERTDPETGAPLDVDGTIGQSDARALVTPILDLAEAEFAIPDHYLRGETNQESQAGSGLAGLLHLLRHHPGVPGRGSGHLADQLGGEPAGQLGPGVRSVLRPALVRSSDVQLLRQVQEGLPAAARLGALGCCPVCP